MRFFEFLPFKRHKFRMRDELYRGGFQHNGMEKREHGNGNKCKGDNDKNKVEWWLMLLIHVCCVARPTSNWVATPDSPKSGFRQQ
jgi:hypothetical protein